MNSPGKLVNFARQMSAWLASDKRRRTFAVVGAAVLVISVAYALVLRNVYFGDRAVAALDDIGEAVAAGRAAAACAWAASRARDRERLGWTLMSISAGLWAAGEVVWSIYEVGLNVATPYPSLADVGFLAAVPFAIGGIRAFWSAPRGTSSHWRVWFDGVIVALALTSTAWGFGLRSVWESDSPTRVFDLAYPVSDILLGTILILAIRRATHQQQGRMILLLGGVAAYSLADSAFSYLTAAGAYGVLGNVIDAGWVVGYLMIALAAIWPASDAMRAVDRTPVDRWQVALPWLTVLLAGASALFLVLSGHELDLFLTALTG